MKKILLITGPAGDAQGWGDIEVTREIAKAIEASGKRAEIAFVSTMEEFYTAIETNKFDIIWSALYHISKKSETIGMGKEDEKWLADIFDDQNIPYIGPNAATMKALINKTATHEIMQANKVPVPWHCQVGPGTSLAGITLPAFVKPSCESRSVGINDDSVVENHDALKKQVAFIHKKFEQPALVEEYLPGSEYTVLMLGNGKLQKFLAGKVEVDASLFGKYPILRADLRGVGATKITPAKSCTNEAVEVTRKAMEALKCLDHVRADMRMDAAGRLKIIEVNGIPGLKPLKSWSPQIFTMHHPAPDGPMEDYRRLIDHIVTSALTRYNII